jgi:hypothetical protein
MGGRAQCGHDTNYDTMTKLIAAGVQGVKDAEAVCNTAIKYGGEEVRRKSSWRAIGSLFIQVWVQTSRRME